MAEAVSLGEENVESNVKPGKDLISTLSVAFSRMRESLKHAMDMLKCCRLAPLHQGSHHGRRSSSRRR
jgi:nitrogen fixation/metabolism regulation signal transduction histidine kinase